MLNTVRVIALAFAGLMLLGAAVVAGDRNAGGVGAALWPAIIGGGIIVVVVMERSRYRSEAAERSRDDAGPGGGEREAVEPRFRPTDEVFFDPTTGRVMRVYLDGRNGERRYVAER